MNINRELAFSVGQILLSLLLILSILLQNRGAGLGQTFGGDSAIFHTKRGLEKRLHEATIVLAIAFLGLAFVRIFF